MLQSVVLVNNPISLFTFWTLLLVAQSDPFHDKCAVIAPVVTGAAVDILAWQISPVGSNRLISIIVSDGSIMLLICCRATIASPTSGGRLRQRVRTRLCTPHQAKRKSELAFGTTRSTLTNVREAVDLWANLDARLISSNVVGGSVHQGCYNKLFRSELPLAFGLVSQPFCR